MANLDEYKCPNCGGMIHFDSHSQNLVCPSCGTEFPISSLAAFNEKIPQEDISWSSSQERFAEQESQNYSVYICKSCGGEIVQEDVDITSRCPFCGNEVVNSGKVSGNLKPNLVIPFKFDKKDAIQHYLKHAQKKYVPHAFLQKDHLQEIRGIYVPFWLFDAKTDSQNRFLASTSRSWREGDYRVIETSHYLLLRDGKLDFEKVPADSSTKMDDILMEAIEPYDYSFAVDFQTAYLAGFLANRYDVSAEEVEKRACERMRSSVLESFANTCIGYETVLPEDNSIHVQGGRKYYALLPIWLLVTRYHNRLYTFAMNGQTGKVVGDFPVDKKAAFFDYLKYLVMISALIFMLYCALYYFA